MSGLRGFDFRLQKQELQKFTGASELELAYLSVASVGSYNINFSCLVYRDPVIFIIILLRKDGEELFWARFAAPKRILYFK